MEGTNYSISSKQFPFPGKDIRQSIECVFRHIRVDSIFLDQDQVILHWDEQRVSESEIHKALCECMAEKCGKTECMHLKGRFCHQMAA